MQIKATPDLAKRVINKITEQLQMPTNPFTGQQGFPNETERQKRFKQMQDRIRDTYEVNPSVFQGPKGKTVTQAGLKELLPDRGRTTTINSLENTGAYTPAEIKRLRVSLGMDALTDDEKRRVASFQRDRGDWDATSDKTVPSKKDDPKGPTVNGRRVPRDWNSDLKPEVDALRQKRENTPRNYENMRGTGEQIGAKLMPHIRSALEKFSSGVKQFRNKVNDAERERRFNASQQRIKDLYSVNPDIAQGPDGKIRTPEGMKEALPNKGKGIEATRDKYNKEVQDFRSEGQRTVPGTGIISPGRTREVNPETGAAEFNPDKNIPGWRKVTSEFDTTTVGGAAKTVNFMRNAQIKPTEAQIEAETAASRRRISQPGYKSNLTDADKKRIVGRVANEFGQDADTLSSKMSYRARGVKGSGPAGSITNQDELEFHARNVGRERREERKSLGLRPRTSDYSLPGGGYDYDAMRSDMEERGEIPASRRGRPRLDTPDTPAQAAFRSGNREQNLQTAAEIMRQIEIRNGAPDTRDQPRTPRRDPMDTGRGE